MKNKKINLRDFVLKPIDRDRIKKIRIRKLKTRKRIFIGFLYLYIVSNIVFIVPLLHASVIFIGAVDLYSLQYSINFTNLAIILIMVSVDLLLLSAWALATLLTGKEEL